MCWLAAAVWLAWPDTTAAQAAAYGGGEIIDDPELASSPASEGQNAGDGSSGQNIDDPELRGSTPGTRGSGGFEGDSSSSAGPSSDVHLTLHARGNRDLLLNKQGEAIK